MIPLVSLRTPKNIPYSAPNTNRICCRILRENIGRLQADDNVSARLEKEVHDDVTNIYARERLPSPISLYRVARARFQHEVLNEMKIALSLLSLEAEADLIN